MSSQEEKPLIMSSQAEKPLLMSSQAEKPLLISSQAEKPLLMSSQAHLLQSARDNPSILDKLSDEYSYVSAGYPARLVRVGMCEERGRGLVATRTIKKGEMVYDDKYGMEVELTEEQLRVHLEVKTDEEKKIFLMHCYCHDEALWYVLGIGR